MIEIKYLKVGTTVPDIRKFTFEEYFDPIESGETYEKDGIPRYDQPHLYVCETPTTLNWVVVTENFSNRWRKIRKQYVCKSEVTHVEESDGSAELIYSGWVGEQDSHIIRISQPTGKNWGLSMDAVVSDNIDGSQIDKPLVSAESRTDIETFFGVD